jgi:hypothetical protein
MLCSMTRTALMLEHFHLVGKHRQPPVTSQVSGTAGWLDLLTHLEHSIH